VTRDQQECGQLALQSSGGSTEQAARGVQSNQQFQQAFNQCTQNRGHAVL